MSKEKALPTASIAFSYNSLYNILSPNKLYKKPIFLELHEVTTKKTTPKLSTYGNKLDTTFKGLLDNFAKIVTSPNTQKRLISRTIRFHTEIFGMLIEIKNSKSETKNELINNILNAIKAGDMSEIIQQVTTFRDQFEDAKGRNKNLNDFISYYVNSEVPKLEGLYPFSLSGLSLLLLNLKSYTKTLLCVFAAATFIYIEAVLGKRLLPSINFSFSK